MNSWTTGGEPTKIIAHKKTIKTSQEKAIAQAGKFPNCKGFYPDCPEKPDKKHSMCRNCPVLDEE